jgi:hypothetical protein
MAEITAASLLDFAREWLRDPEHFQQGVFWWAEGEQPDPRDHSDPDKICRTCVVGALILGLARQDPHVGDTLRSENSGVASMLYRRPVLDAINRLRATVVANPELTPTKGSVESPNSLLYDLNDQQGYLAIRRLLDLEYQSRSTEKE